MKSGFDPAAIAGEYPRVRLFPFDSERKRISIVRAHNGRNTSFVKGSIESLLPLCVLAGFALIPFGIPPIILPVQILLVDLVGEMLPLLMLTDDPAMPWVMQLRPRKKGALLDKEKLVTIGLTGLVRGLISTAVFIAVFRAHTGQEGAWETGLSATFVTIVMTQFVGIFFLAVWAGCSTLSFFLTPGYSGASGFRR